jgi:hypothetical protein
VSDETELNGTEPSVPEGAAVVAAPKAPSADFLSTTAGKAVLVGGAVVVLLIIAAVVGWFVLGPSSLGTGPTGTPTTVVPVPSQPASVPASTTPSTVPTVPAADITSRDVFTPRNPFTPIAAPTITTKSSSSHTTTSTTGTTSDSDVVLKDIVTVSGVRKAVIAYGGHTYTLGAGELIPTTTDWKVLAVNANSAVVQFGDVNVTLTPGQGTTK